MEQRTSITTHCVQDTNALQAWPTCRAKEVASTWAGKVRPFLPGYIDSQPALASVIGDLQIALHGSTTAGIDDDYSDIDLWGFVSPESLAKADELSPTRFFEFKIDGKPGHLTLETRADAHAWLESCRLEKIAELRHAVPLTTGSFVPQLIASARTSMSEELRRKLVCYYYVEFRSEHRACDTPIERGLPVSLLLAMTRAMEQALRCAMLIDGEPFPYCKWLASAAAATPTGSKVFSKVNDVLDLVACNALRQGGPEKQHAISLKLREIRAILIESAIASGINEAWLTQWWLYMTQAREGLGAARWR